MSAAARALGQTQPTLGRQVSALEQALGVTLFERAGRSLTLTQSGRDLLAAADEMRTAALAFSLSAEGHNQSVTGDVSLTATDFVATFVLPDILTKLRTRAPGISVNVIASNDVQDLTKRAADISIRHARPEQPDLIARRMGERYGQFYASPTYWDTYGRPTQLTDLAEADFVGFENTDRTVEILTGMGIQLDSTKIRVTSGSGAVICALAQAGMGVTVLTNDQAELAGGLEPVLTDQVSIPVPVWLVTHRELHTSRRIRLVFDHLADHLSRHFRA